MEAVQKGEFKIMCPYNAAHYIRRNRMEFHLVKCRKSYEGKCDLVPCDFNSTHRVPEPEIQYHHDTCPDKGSIEVAVIEADDATSFLAPKSAARSAVPSDSSWDDAPPVPSYDPMKYCMENNILRRIDTAPAAVRRDFRIQERQRVEQVSKQNKDRGLSNGDTRRRNREEVELPPVPLFKAETVEEVPAEIQRKMAELTLRSIRPPVALIPKKM